MTSVHRSQILPMLREREGRRDSRRQGRSPAKLMGFGARRLRAQARAALPGEVGPEPPGLHPEPVLQLRQRHEMQEDPDEPGDKPAHAEAPALQDREILADDAHVALVAGSERMLRLASLEFPRDQASDI